MAVDSLLGDRRIATSIELVSGLALIIIGRWIVREASTATSEAGPR